MPPNVDRGLPTIPSFIGNISEPRYDDLVQSYRFFENSEEESTIFEYRVGYHQSVEVVRAFQYAVLKLREDEGFLHQLDVDVDTEAWVTSRDTETPQEYFRTRVLTTIGGQHTTGTPSTTFTGHASVLIPSVTAGRLIAAVIREYTSDTEVQGAVPGVSELLVPVADALDTVLDRVEKGEIEPGDVGDMFYEIGSSEQP